LKLLFEEQLLLSLLVISSPQLKNFKYGARAVPPMANLGIAMTILTRAQQKRPSLETPYSLPKSAWLSPLSFVCTASLIEVHMSAKKFVMQGLCKLAIVKDVTPICIEDPHKRPVPVKGP
uniref:Uncharacterized protein n=1 Tax=Romanomermis culicivorax TaxID=13658 RepID=A0A915KD06_ROMCU